MNGERNRAMYVLKSRGTAHSNQVREFLLTSSGIRLVQPYLGPEGVLTGSARIAQEAKEAAAALLRQQEAERQRREIEQRREAIQSQIAALHAELEARSQELDFISNQENERQQQLTAERAKMAARRGSAAMPAPGTNRRLPMKRTKADQ
jgi:circadian clock protein KaiC